MKISKKLAFLGLSLMLLLAPYFYTNAYLDSETSMPTLNQSDNSPPVIIYNTSEISSTGNLYIKVYDAENSLSAVVIEHNNYTLTSGTTGFSFSWSFVNYTTTPPPLSPKRGEIEETAPSGMNTYDATIDVDEVFVTTDHNDIKVTANNTDSLESYSTMMFCNQVECWGRGGGAETTNPIQVDDVQVGEPNLTFDMRGFWCCGYISPYIRIRNTDILNFTIILNDTNNMLTMSVFDIYEINYKAAVIVNGTIELFGYEECDCEIDPTGTGSPANYFLIPVVFGFIFIVAILTYRKRKKKV